MADSKKHKIKTTFFGTTSIFITDGETNIFIDAFLSRPGLFKVLFSKIGPDIPLIKSTLQKAQITSLDALFVAHTHYDHVLDAPEVITQRGGKLYGSESTLNIARGYNTQSSTKPAISPSDLQLIRENDTYQIGAFTVRIFEGLHSPGNKFPGDIPSPLPLPTRCSHLKDGGCFSFYISHPEGNMLIHPSANYVPGKFEGLEIDVLYLGIGVLGSQPRDFREEYWRHLVGVTRPRVILPIHWDDFFVPLRKGLVPMPWYMDRFGQGRKLVESKAREEGIGVVWQGPLETLEVFSLKSQLGQETVGEGVLLSGNGPLLGSVMASSVTLLGVAAVALAVYWQSL